MNYSNGINVLQTTLSEKNSNKMMGVSPDSYKYNSLTGERFGSNPDVSKRLENFRQLTKKRTAAPYIGSRQELKRYKKAKFQKDLEENDIDSKIIKIAPILGIKNKSILRGYLSKYNNDPLELIKAIKQKNKNKN